MVIEEILMSNRGIEEVEEGGMKKKIRIEGGKGCVENEKRVLRINRLRLEMRLEDWELMMVKKIEEEEKD